MPSEETRETPDCFVCAKHRGRTTVPGEPIYQDRLVYVGHADLRPDSATVYLGYLMVEPRRHIPDLASLTDEEAAAIGLTLARASQALQVSEGAEHVYAFVMGDDVPHLHIHLVPRYPGAPRQYWGVHVDEWPDAPRGGVEDVEAVCRRLQALMIRE